MLKAHTFRTASRGTRPQHSFSSRNRSQSCSRRLRGLHAIPDESAYPEIPEVDQQVKTWGNSDAEEVQTSAYLESQGGLPASEPPEVPLMARLGNGALFGLAALFGGTFLVSTGTYFYNYNQPKAKQRRQLLKNQKVVRSLSELLPNSRDKVTPNMLRMLQLQTGFSAVDIFRKFLWFVLKDRKFDQDALDDLIQVKTGLALTNDQVAEALKERCIRIEKKFGNLMLSTEGLSEKGVQRKATCRALFSKMLYLVENEQVLQQNEVLSVDVLRDIFGATEDDIARLRIVSIQEVDLDVLDAMVGSPDKE